MNSQDKPFFTMSFLAWVDAIERLDTLLLEFRHLQINICHSLRESSLYAPLREEEKYIWGKCPDLKNNDEEIIIDWVELFKKPDFSLADIRQLAHFWCPKYPSFRGNKVQTGDNHNCPNKLESVTPRDPFWKEYDKITHRLNDIRQNGEWSNDLRRHYYNLCSSQIIKRNILRDKLALCWWGYKAFGLYSSKLPFDKGSISHFLMVRSAVVARARRYVTNLGDLQAQLEKSMDMSLQDNPRPMLGRRREQGIYTAFLSESARDIGNQIVDFLEKIGAPQRGERFGAAKSRAPIVMHRWAHSYTSSCHVFEDEIKTRPSTSSVPNEPKRENKTDLLQNIHFINSSFWLPEQPSLQPIIAHEVAHNAIYERYGYLDSRSLKEPKDRFGSLIQQLHFSMERSGLSREDPRVDKKHLPDYIIREITADILAASSKGTAYLVAMFYEILASGIEVLFHAPIDRFDLDAAKYLKESNPRHDLEKKWYLRLRVVCTWVRKTKASDCCSLTNTVIDGIESIANYLVEHIGRIASHGRYSEIYRYWILLADRLCEIVEDSDAAKEAKKINQEISPEHFRKNENLIRKYPQHMEPLNEEIREFLINCWIEEKKSDDRFLHELFKSHTFKDYLKYLSNCRDKSFLFDQSVNAFIETLSMEEKEAFEELKNGGSLEKFKPINRDKITKPFVIAFLSNFYFDKYISNNCSTTLSKPSSSQLQKLNLFTHIHDIPWQCSISRALDFINKDFLSNDNIEHRNTDWISRMHNSMPLGREIYSVGLEFYLWHYRTASDRLTTTLRAIKHIQASDSKEFDAGEIVSKIETWKTAGAEDRQKIDNLISACEIFTETKYNADKKSEVLSQIQEIGALSLISFEVSRKKQSDRFIQKRILGKLQGYKLEQLSEILQKSPPNSVFFPLSQYLKHHSHTSDGSIALHKKVFRSMGYDSNDLPKKIETCLLSRISISGPRKNQPGASLYQSSLTKSYQFQSNGKQHWYEPVLGRQDALMIEQANPLVRCSLPKFKNSLAAKEINSFDFLPFFTRRELTVSTRLNGNIPLFQKSSFDESECPNEFEFTFLAALSIVVNERATRLDLLARLIKSAELNIAPTQDSPHNLEQAIYFLGEFDTAFLCEGWGDIVLVFYEKNFSFDNQENNQKRLQNIFAIQNALYQDFMVERTELLFSPNMIPVAANVTTEAQSAYSISTQIRITEDRDLEKYNDKFTDILRMSPHKENFEAFHIPGRTDFQINFKNKYFKDKNARVSGLLEEAFQDGLIDIMMTTIGQRVS
ncbi:hypothetical protein GCM10011332_32020 [Terasakiella brassicae]|uniref:Uncharacterized protein n=1 Tax=Terasakiella brassicae TaxID=1634917 RepID=A0A917C909_9PROT|nr:hypothetical protein [Terasakiella brassicae]GGF75618.1 hypothetical protein GCM10011332_32020 [Terasakiella brassicae]